MIIGHNSIAADQLKSIVSRIEKLEEEKASIGADIKDVYAETKANGFCPKTIKAIVKIRKLDANEREEAETILDTYLHALGMIVSQEVQSDDPIHQ